MLREKLASKARGYKHGKREGNAKPQSQAGKDLTGDAGKQAGDQQDRAHGQKPPRILMIGKQEKGCRDQRHGRLAVLLLAKGQNGQSQGKEQKHKKRACDLHNVFPPSSKWAYIIIIA